MATFKTIVRYKRADGFYQVYIRVLHRSKSGYIKTDKFVTDKQLSKSGEIKDAVINKYCAQESRRSPFMDIYLLTANFLQNNYYITFSFQNTTIFFA